MPSSGDALASEQSWTMGVGSRIQKISRTGDPQRLGRTRFRRNRCSLTYGRIKSFSTDARQIPPESIQVERRKYQIVASRRKQEANDCNRCDGHISPSASRVHFAFGENVNVRKTIVVRANGSPALWTKPRDWLLRGHTPVANLDGISLANC